MQARRATRTRATNENADENRAATTRLTRAKAASLTKPSALAAKPTNATVNPVARGKRNVLVDVSNVGKAEPVGGEKKVVKKAVSKVTAVKASTTTTTTAAAAKPANRQALKPLNTGNRAVKPAPKAKEPVQVDEKKNLKRREPEPEKEEDVENVPPPKAPGLKERDQPKVEEQVDRHVDKRPRSAKTLPRDVVHDNLDEDDAGDPLMVSEYVEEIFEYLRELEPQAMPHPLYMDHQADLQWSMRGILVDWLVEVHTRFRLLPETLFLCVNIVDRFLSTKTVPLEKLQLVGLTAMFIAAKYEEVFSPHVQYFRHVADNGYSEDEILRAERYILATLDYNLSYPNPMNFLRRISKADEYDFQTRTFAKYLMEISLVDHRFLKYPPSRVAAAAMYMSRLILNRGEWHNNMVYYSDYTEEQIIPVVQLFIDYLVRPVKHQAFYKKYASKKFMKASLHGRHWSKNHAKEYGVDANVPFDEVDFEASSSVVADNSLPLDDSA
ncbi:A/B/D/E cyclin [Ascodesmis nigricans]|uniref:A/B/D/E cyclin n=1 Tax=Ascodesmis nigricans TaxID=341454 RepID=A0A4S2MTC8_9PEZI|nr:A/B/D/E cyclin [Ascodesmis nigricans]